jgi:hypothetical protein
VYNCLQKPSVAVDLFSLNIFQFGMCRIPVHLERLCAKVCVGEFALSADQTASTCGDVQRMT